MNILFLHGWQSTPGGLKPTYLKDHGHTVLNPRLPDDLRKGNDRVLMFENGKWQPLRPHKPAILGQRRLGLTEFSFGPEIAFGHKMAKAWPGETVGIIKHAAGGTSLLAWKPDWNKADAARVGQVGRGPLYKQLMEKVRHASKARDIEIAGFLWLQGGGDSVEALLINRYPTLPLRTHWKRNDATEINHEQTIPACGSRSLALATWGIGCFG